MPPLDPRYARADLNLLPLRPTVLPSSTKRPLLRRLIAAIHRR
jgi:hypothetical protein